MKKLIIIITLVFLFGSSSFSQRQLVAVGWEVNFPSNTKYIDKTSFAGGKVEYRHFIKDNLSAGLALDWATYEQYFSRQTFQKPDGNGAVTGDFVAQVYQVPFTATVHYYFEKKKTIEPYIGAALGANYLEQSLYYNVYVSDDNNWGFVARPELGTIIKTNPLNKWGFLAAVNYSYSTNKTGIINSDSFKNIGFTIGVAFWQ